MSDRRSSVPFDPKYFARRAASGESRAPVDAFRHAWQTNFWSGPESPSGQGASLEQTARIREALPAIVHRYVVRTLLDLPCGDCHWISRVPLPEVQYTGGDLLPEISGTSALRLSATARSGERRLH